MFIIGASIIILITLLRQFIELLTYAVILIIGTAVLGRGVTNWYEHTLGIKAKKWLLSELNIISVITEFIFQFSGSQSFASGPATSTSFGNLIKMHFLGPCPSNGCFNIVILTQATVSQT